MRASPFILRLPSYTELLVAMCTFKCVCVFFLIYVLCLQDTLQVSPKRVLGRSTSAVTPFQRRHVAGKPTKCVAGKLIFLSSVLGGKSSVVAAFQRHNVAGNFFDSKKCLGWE